MAQTAVPPKTEARHTNRVARLYARLWEGMLSKREWWGDGLTILDDPEVAALPLIVRKAKAIEKVLTEMPVEIKPEELVVGTMPMGSLGTGFVFPQYATESERSEAAKKSLSIYSVYGHSVPNYAEVLELGLDGIKQKVAAKLSATTDGDPAAERQRNFLQATTISMDAVIALAHRYADLATAMAAQEEDQQRRAELLGIANVCQHVPEYPPRSFREALQSFWFMFASLNGTLTVAPVGRFDYYMYPFLKRDLDAGDTTLDDAQELVDCLWIKFSERVQIKEEHREYHRAPLKAGVGRDPEDGPQGGNSDSAFDNHWLQNLILSGLSPDGKDSTNDLTYLCLESTGHFEVHEPTVSVRLSRHFPDALLRKCCEVIRGGGGMPALHNDRMIIDALVKFGFPLEEANGYSHDGCWETLIPGKTDFRWGPVHALLALELVFTRGRSRVSDRKEGLDTGDVAAFRSFDELMDAFKAQLDYQTCRFIDNFAEYWDARYSIAPEPLLSCLIEGCLEQSKDLTEGGARYMFYAPVVAGVPHTADALAAIKKLIFEERQMTMAQLADAVASNYADQEPLRQLLLTHSPKFGNGIDYVDELAREIAHFFVESVRKHGGKHPQFKFPPGTGAIGGTYMAFGKIVGATPDGRAYREAITAGLTPAPGRDLEGPTAAVRSYTTVDFSELPIGGPLDLGMSPSGIGDEAGLQRLMAFVRSFVEMGGSMLTITVTDVETLLKAQAEPEKYRGLRVRMGGWQAYFTALTREHQDNHIARVRHSLC
ncbi:MAG: hypothetical protein M1531_03930 [Chloroflexi bacterium]|nr:hypothetical protein [Chloroflexota bacterium]